MQMETKEAVESAVAGLLTILVDAKKYASMIGRDVYILRRGKSYKVSQIPYKNWRLVTTIKPAIEAAGFTKEFVGEEDFHALYAAQRWLTENGYCYGSQERGNPTGIMKGPYDISKWRHMSRREIDQLDGRMTAPGLCFRSGPVTIHLKNPPK
jgi:hypothetical protein